MWLDPFSRENAVDFLSPRLGALRANALVTTLEQRDIPALYGNPLTLELFAAVATEDEVPTTRAELMQRASDFLWCETNDRKRGSPLSTLDMDTAIKAAGAVSAAFVLTGSEAITLNPSSALTPATLPVAEIGQLPNAAPADALLGSRCCSRPSRALTTVSSRFMGLSPSFSVPSGSPSPHRTTSPASVCLLQAASERESGTRLCGAKGAALRGRQGRNGFSGGFVAWHNADICSSLRVCFRG